MLKPYICSKIVLALVELYLHRVAMNLVSPSKLTHVTRDLDSTFSNSLYSCLYSLKLKLLIKKEKDIWIEIILVLDFLHDLQPLTF